MALLLCSGTMLLHSCISEEPLNMECDITSITLNIDDPTTVFYNAADASKSISELSLTYTQDTITFITRIDANIGSFPVTLNYTEGATPYLYTSETTSDVFKNGSSVDFSDGTRHFRIVSQDEAWHRDYFVKIVHRNKTGGDMLFDFSEYLLDPQNSEKFYIWPATDENAVNGFMQGDIYWKNGNPGYKLSKSTAKPNEYPTVPAVGAGPDGSDCVKMETMDTGSFGKMVGLLMASGSMFTGSFDVANALKNALKATVFGRPFAHKPIRFSFDMKYEPAANFQNSKGEFLSNVVDEPDAYLCVYRINDINGKPTVINGANVVSSENIVGMARLPHNTIKNADGSISDLPSNTPIHGVEKTWTHVVLDVNYTEEIDLQLLANMGYGMYIGFASSWQGAYFEGAIGSKCWIDNVRVECAE